jgi:hypothetical protein
MQDMQYMHNCILCIYCIFIAHGARFCIACIFEHLQRNLVAVRLLSDSDDDPMDPKLNDDQAPGDWDALPVQLSPPAPTCRPGRQADMHKTMPAMGGITHDIDKAMLAMDAHIGHNPDQANPIQSDRCGRKSKQAELKQKARHITWSMAESFEYFTSK